MPRPFLASTRSASSLLISTSVGIGSAARNPEAKKDSINIHGRRRVVAFIELAGCSRIRVVRVRWRGQILHRTQGLLEFPDQGKESLADGIKIHPINHAKNE